ncbi:DoxX family protein [Algoriphagus sp. A40]|uniref:DoxX family protein n=1 Tax=Algoriphagus sp. A40 TaxID=1945863 RepID=UPI000987A32B|nr:DoxX family protein [Algoriphagus sp. A40]OOG73687.1 hypothetical protein B0E43_12615 [Algoriphagus sp. A40]
MKSISKLYQIRLLNPAILLIRLWLGTVMLKHSGTYLFQGKVPELAAFLESLNWPYPLVLAYASQIAEFVAAILILFGIRFGAWMMAFALGIAVLFAHSGKIYSDAELPFNYFLFSLILILTGCGKPGIDSIFLKKIKNKSPYKW